MYYIIEYGTSNGIKQKILESPDDEKIKSIFEKINSGLIIAKTDKLTITVKKRKNIVKNIFDSWLTPASLFNYYSYNDNNSINIEIPVDEIVFDRPYKGQINNRKLKKIEIDNSDVDALFNHWRSFYSLSQTKLTPVKKLKFKAYLDVLDKLDEIDYKNVITISSIIT